jgi:hypothetical protein
VSGERVFSGMRVVVSGLFQVCGFLQGGFLSGFCRYAGFGERTFSGMRVFAGGFFVGILQVCGFW